MFTIYDLLKNFIARFYGNMNSDTIREQHIDIVKAIKERDPEKTREAILHHLDYVETCIRDALGISGDQAVNYDSLRSDLENGSN
jgi:DNA-binding FadR family transcriptional regulator